MIHRRSAAGFMAAALALAAAAPVAATEEPATPQPESAMPQVWLKGAFGRVPGGSSTEPATAAPDQRALDTWMRQAPLELSTDVPFEDVLGLAVVARAIEDDREEVLSEGASSFEGPDLPGRHLLIATLETDPTGTSEHAWLVDVPERDGGPEALFDIPGPVARLGSTTGEITGLPGHGCYAYLCVEAGLRPPSESLEPLTVAVGETPVLRLEDGSGMIHWQGNLEPITGDETSKRVAQETFEGPPQATLDLVGLEPTAAGEWLLEVRADYDRERGWGWFLYRLIAE